jgi:hypothetical protein
MFIFLRLLLAHFIGDFPLQFSKIYKLKSKNLKSGLPHSFIITSLFVLFSWPYLQLPGLWVFILFLGITHLFQDWIKILITKNIKGEFWLYLLDQLSHVTLISLIFFTGLKNLAPPLHINGPIISLYTNDTIIIYLIILIAATYNGTYLMLAFKNTFLKEKHKYTHLEKWYGIIERAITVTVFIPAGIFLIIIPFIFYARLLIKKIVIKHNLKLSREFASFSEILLSGIIALAAGIVLYILK